MEWARPRLPRRSIADLRVEQALAAMNDPTGLGPDNVFPARRHVIQQNEWIVFRLMALDIAQSLMKASTLRETMVFALRWYLFAPSQTSWMDDFPKGKPRHSPSKMRPPMKTMIFKCEISKPSISSMIFKPAH